MKLLKALAITAALVLTSACTEMVPVKSTEVAFEINSDGTWKNKVYNGENVFIEDWCNKHCDDAHIWESQQMVKTIESDYAMPQSNDMDLTLGLTLKVTLNKDGTDAEFRERLMAASKRYVYSVEGSPDDPQKFRTTLMTIFNVDLNKAQVKSKVRPILEPFELSTAYYNISKGGTIIQDIFKAIEQHLKDIGSPLKLLSVQVERVAQPIELLNKKKEEEGLESQEKIQMRQLAMKERRMVREQLIALKATANELQILKINAPFMTPEVLAYKWIQTANLFAEKGLPFATTPEMLLPAISKLTDMRIDTSQAEAELRKTIKSVENEVKKGLQCAEGNC